MQLFQNVFPEGGLFLAVVDLLGAVLDSFQPSNGKAPIWDGVAWRKSALKKLSNVSLPSRKSWSNFVLIPAMLRRSLSKSANVLSCISCVFTPHRCLASNVSS